MMVLAASGEMGECSLFVAVDGSDRNPGTQERPFATLQRAQQAARLHEGEGATIFLRDGTYYLHETLTFSAEDSGTASAPVVVQAYAQERVVISGASPLENLDWEPYRDGIMQARVPSGFSMDQFYVNGALQPMARYPNFDADAHYYNGYAPDAFSPERAAGWRDPRGAFIHALHTHEWGGMHYVITGKSADNEVSYEGGWQNNRPLGMHADIRFVENVFEELDAPGEWFLDRAQSMLYYCPLEGLDLSTAKLEGAALKCLIALNGSEHAPVRFVSFKGLTFTQTARTFMENYENILRTDWALYRGGAIFFAGAEDCSVEDCAIEDVGGNAVFVNNYNRRIAVQGCHITRAGGSGVAFIGDIEAVHNGIGWEARNHLDAISKTPGPKTSNYPGDCRVEDCLIHKIGLVEKQVAGVTVDVAEGITVRHCSIYDMPRSGINFGDGAWGGHLIEFCDVFDTVKETGDHGSFNSWGRDRFWGLDGLDINDDASWEAHKSVVTLDAWKTTVIRNSRWRCDHGWDIDLDDGSSNYHIHHNLLLNGGLKHREGFFRVVENNILIDGFHPHVWYKHSEDVVRRNIMVIERYRPAGGMPETPWGKEMDFNLAHRTGTSAPEPATRLAEQSRRDEHSIVADAMFVDPARGDFRVQDASPALGLGFENFPMDQFGVQKPALKTMARTPEFPDIAHSGSGLTRDAASTVLDIQVRDIVGLGDRSAYGLPDETGVLVLSVPENSPAANAGLRKDDVITACDNAGVETVSDLRHKCDQASGKTLVYQLFRKQERMSVAF